LCNLFGEEIENGEMPADITWVGKVIKDICYYNAQHYFNWPKEEAFVATFVETNTSC